MRLLIPLFILVPLVEIWLFILSGKFLGIWATLGIVILTGILGATRAKKEGTDVFRRAKEQINLGRLPGDELIEGLFVFVGGLLLLTPGYLTDVTGLFLMIPRTRKRLVKRLRDALRKRIQNGSIQFYFKR